MLLFQRKNVFRLLIIILCVTIFYNEVFGYFLAYLLWPSLKCGELTNLHSLLLVADPQILGEQSEIWFARWDNDRYLKKVFATALHSVVPDLVVFLGDLMDEGSVATDEEFSRYYARFRDIFQLHYIPSNMTFFLPGDNDIGGEDEIVSQAKVRRFKKFFHSPTVLTLGNNVQIVQVDKMRSIVPDVPLHAGPNKTRVVVSHMPMLGLPSFFTQEVLQKLRPQVIISAHDHKSVHFSGDLDTGERLVIEPLIVNKRADKKASWRFQSSSHIVNEVVVPTCSYRMGVRDMGFSLALFDNSGEAWCYHVLWLPSRFLALFAYVAVLLLVLLMLVCGPVCHRLPWLRLRRCCRK